MSREGVVLFLQINEKGTTREFRSAGDVDRF
jgi:hypothetical protein